MLQYKTRGNCSPQGLQKVYFTCHPDDYAQYFSTFSDMILKEQNCAVVYDPEQSDYEDMETDLGRMQLFVIPVTTRLLTKPNRTIEIDLPFALRKHIPVLPLMMEDGLEELYARYFKDLHFLSPNKRDDTAISFEEKFKKYLGYVLVGDEMAEKVRKAFDAYIFLSYRKKDRSFAQKLMRLIHKNEFSRDIAIWYDEFLNPGEDFTAAIDAAIEKSKLFALVVTPHLLEKNDQGNPNYVMSTEYPEAKKRCKAVLPAEMDPTDGKQLAAGFEGLDRTVNADDEAELAAALRDALAEYAKAENDDDPEHNFFIGLAYLGGIDVETDHARALELITFAAEHENPVSEAIKKLINMYRNGEGVERDYHKAIEWQRKLVKVNEKRAEEEPIFDNCSALVTSVWNLGQELMEVGNPAEAEKAFSFMHELCEKYSANLKASYRYELSRSFRGLGDARRRLGNLKGAEEYYSRSISICDQMASDHSGILQVFNTELPNALVKLGDLRLRLGNISGAEACFNRALELYEESEKEERSYFSYFKMDRVIMAMCMERLGDVQMKLGNLHKAEEYYARSLTIDEQLALKNGTPYYMRNLSCGLNDLGRVCQRKGDLKGAEKYYFRSLEIREKLANEIGSVQAKRDLGLVLGSIGDVRSDLGDLKGAVENYSRSLYIIKQLADETETIQAQTDYSLVLHRLGGVLIKLGDLRVAKSIYLIELEIDERLVKLTRDQGSRRDVMVCLSNLGDISRESGDLKSAEDYYLRSAEIAEQLTESVKTVSALYDFSSRLNSLGNVRSARGDLQGAEKCYLRKTEIDKWIAAKHGSANARHNYMVSLEQLGDTLKLLHDFRGAEKHYSNALEVAEQLANEDSTVEAWRDVSFLLISLGIVLEAQGDFIEAEKYYTSSISVRRQVAEQTQTAQSYDEFAYSMFMLATMRKPYNRELLQKAYDIWARLSEEHPESARYAEKRNAVAKELAAL